MSSTERGIPVTEMEVDFLERQHGPFFRRVDWGAFWTAFIIALGAYILTLAPTVTLEDSGELAVASDYLGVPHPPGYPIWSLLTWFFQWIFNFVKYNGHPNPAWSVGLASAVMGAAACGILALLVSRSASDILRSFERETLLLGRANENMISWVSGVSGGLLFAFSPVLWSQSVIVEVYSLNAFFLMLIIILTYRWMCRPHEDQNLYTAAFIFGLGLTNHQSLIFIFIGLMVAVWFRDRRLFRDFLAAGFVLLAGYLFWKVTQMKAPEMLSPEDMRTKRLTELLAFAFLIAPVGLFLIERKLMTEWKRVVIVFALIALGVSFYAYMPFSSEQNPPINWGYPRTMEGFKHAITRGQYEKISPVKNLQDAIKHPQHFMLLLWTIILNPRDYISVVSQFLWMKSLTPFSVGALMTWLTLFIPLLALIPLIAIFFVNRPARNWLLVTLAAFLSMTVIFVVFQYPKLDVQTLFIGRVQYIQAHAIFALWISYGMAFGLAYLDALLGGRKSVLYVGAAIMLMLPLVPVGRNWLDPDFLKIVGACEQNGHDFGWQFGNWGLRGVKGIKDDFQAELSPEEFEKVWAEYPNPDYPPEMGTNAIFFGGTDPGRFVPTYMIYSGDVRPDVYLITQNALADNTYMNVMRDLYGDEIWIPSQQDSNYAFHEYVQDVQAGRIPPGAAVSFKDGRVSVQGVQGVMMINGILARMIFEANKHKHDFYVEESYVIPWMYPYLEPHGLIMKINREKLPDLTPEMMKNDREFWDWYTKRLLSNPKFYRDIVARKTFSKLRSAIAGLYTARRKMPQAEYAFQQAIDLYPLSPEANFRLADVFMQQGKYKQAEDLIASFYKKDPGNDKVQSYLDQIKNTGKADQRRQELEQALSSGKAGLQQAFELAELYQRLGRKYQFEQLTMQILNDTNMPPNIYLQVGQLFANAKRYDMLQRAFVRYLQREPNNAKIWVELAALQSAMNQKREALISLRKAIELGGEPVRDIARRDDRFKPLREEAEFKKLVPAANNAMALPLPGM